MIKTTRLSTLLLIVCTCTLLAACHGRKQPSFESHMLYGKWVNGTEYYRFDSNGSGATWDISEDVSEEEAQLFTWEFDEQDNSLTIIHQMDMGGVIPKTYTVTMLNELLLRFKDRYGQIFTFKHVTSGVIQI